MCGQSFLPKPRKELVKIARARAPWTRFANLLSARAPGNSLFILNSVTRGTSPSPTCLQDLECPGLEDPPLLLQQVGFVKFSGPGFLSAYPAEERSPEPREKAAVSGQQHPHRWAGSVSVSAAHPRRAASCRLLLLLLPPLSLLRPRPPLFCPAAGGQLQSGLETVESAADRVRSVGGVGVAVATSGC